MSQELAGRTALVTGAGGGIGRATALALSDLGAAIVVNDIGLGEGDRSLAEAVAQEIRTAGGRASANRDSVCERPGAERMVEQALDEFQGLDILINNAGVALSGSPFEIDPMEFDRVVATHGDRYYPVA